MVSLMGGFQRACSLPTFPQPGASAESPHALGRIRIRLPCNTCWTGFPRLPCPASLWGALSLSPRRQVPPPCKEGSRERGGRAGGRRVEPPARSFTHAQEARDARTKPSLKLLVAVGSGEGPPATVTPLLLRLQGRALAPASLRKARRGGASPEEAGTTGTRV